MNTDQLVKCCGCKKLFTYRKGIKFHSAECREAYYKARRLARSTEMWDHAEEYVYPDALKGLDFAQRAQQVLAEFLSEGARFYRVGIPRTPDEEHPRIRWFPVALDNSRVYLTINHFQEPQDLPLGGLYVVALFTSNRQLLEVGTPFKLRFYQVNQQMPWSRGSASP